MSPRTRDFTTRSPFDERSGPGRERVAKLVEHVFVRSAGTLENVESVVGAFDYMQGRGRSNGGEQRLDELEIGRLLAARVVLETDAQVPTPLGRMARAAEIANGAAIAAGDGASYLTATTIFADGGLMHSSVGL